MLRDRSSTLLKPRLGPGVPNGGGVDEDSVAAIRSSLRDEAAMKGAMRPIEIRHTANCCTPTDHAAYRALWIASALRQSPGRAPYVPAAFDELLAERARLEGEVRRGRLRVAVEEAFVLTPEDGSPAAAYQ
jgi:hypothetical protein